MVKKEVTHTFFNPEKKISFEEFYNIVENNEDFVWDEILVQQGKIIVENRLPGHVNNDKYFYYLIRNNYFDNDIHIYFICPHSGYSRITFETIVPYEALKMFYDIAQSIDCDLRDYYTEELIGESYLEELRIKEENRGIKLNKEQRNVITSFEDQCRWIHIPTNDLGAILKVLNITYEIYEGELTEQIDDIQMKCKIGIATFMESTILFGMNVPYIIYPDLESYEKSDDNFTKDLFESLNKLSKTFGSAQYFEYNNDDEQIGSLALSKKGKLVYAKFTSEGMGQEFFGTQKKTMEVDQKTILKSAKKLGMTPEDMLVGIMKQKMQIKYFEQANWFIESKMKLYSGH